MVSRVSVGLGPVQGPMFAGLLDPMPSLVLGYAGFTEDEILRAVERLEGAFAARGRG